MDSYEKAIAQQTRMWQNRMEGGITPYAETRAGRREAKAFTNMMPRPDMQTDVNLAYAADRGDWNKVHALMRTDVVFDKANHKTANPRQA